jgi:hypothetical protein
MKVKCIDNKGFHNLTICKIYNIIYDDKDDFRYFIKDDINEKWGYPKRLFKPLSEIRNDKINKLLEE